MHGVNFEMRFGKKLLTARVLVVISVDRQGMRKVIGLQSGDKESASSWRALFHDLKHQWLDAARVERGIMDGLPALEKVSR